VPNWCNNSITIRGTNQREISEIADAMNEGRFLKTVIPIPEDQKDNWYDFCVNNWGTKWEVDCQNVEVEDDGLSVSCFFDSAWAPPVGVAEALVERGLAVTLYYHECGMCFVGKYEDGVDDYYEYSSENSETVRAAIGDELDDMFGISENMAEYEAENPDEELTEWLKDGIEKRQLIDANNP
jgi:hypothetical protein